jgi:histidyl-tRNA synthetase
MEQIGGPPTPGIGFGVGIERLIINLERQNIPIPTFPPASVFVAHIGNEAKSMALMLSHRLRKKGIDTILGPADRSLRAQMRYVNSVDIPFAIIVGEQELQNDVVILRDMTIGEQTELTIEDAIAKVKESKQT